MPRPAGLDHCRPLRNGPEEAFRRAFTAGGWTVSKRGWPDFFCLHRDGDIMCVEVKPHRGRRLKVSQSVVLKALAAYGVPCFRWSPDGGLERIEP